VQFRKNYPYSLDRPRSDESYYKAELWKCPCGERFENFIRERLVSFIFAKFVGV